MNAGNVKSNAAGIRHVNAVGLISYPVHMRMAISIMAAGALRKHPH